MTISRPIGTYRGAWKRRLLGLFNITGEEVVELCTFTYEAHGYNGVWDRKGIGQNFPNPFNAATVIPFLLPTAGDVSVHVFNPAGQKVATLLRGFREAGSYTLVWDGKDDQDRPLASGIYLYRLQAGDRLQTRKVMLIKLPIRDGRLQFDSAITRLIPDNFLIRPGQRALEHGVSPLSDIPSQQPALLSKSNIYLLFQNAIVPGPP